MKKLYKSLSGLFISIVSLFEISELKRFATLLADGSSEYMGEVIVKGVYMFAIIAAGVLIIANKKKASAICLTLAGGVALYKAFGYILRVVGNEMIFGIVLGNVIDMVEFVLFAAPIAVVMLSESKMNEKSLRGAFVSVVAALAVALSGRIITFVSWGKSFVGDLSLFFEAYGLDILRTLVMFLAAVFYIWHLMPEKRKKRR